MAAFIGSSAFVASFNFSSIMCKSCAQLELHLYRRLNDSKSDVFWTPIETRETPNSPSFLASHRDCSTSPSRQIPARPSRRWRRQKVFSSSSSTTTMMLPAIPRLDEDALPNVVVVHCSRAAALFHVFCANRGDVHRTIRHDASRTRNEDSPPQGVGEELVDSRKRKRVQNVWC